MAWVTSKEVKALVKSSMTNSEYDQIVNLAQEEIEAKAGTSTYSANLRFAVLYLSAANTLRALKTNGELAYTNKIGATHQINEIDDMIAKYDGMSELYIKKNKVASLSSTPQSAIDIIPANYYEAEE
ncbi:MAG TPA: hypothetical protein PLN36_01400 [Bacteroidales bacterium]|nr:hypothetical protein [Bacteroidales bacterium]HRT38795.1 hypothetical protein [Rectinema sp.]HRU33965.1 hypothetical protein [Bacteroidales bacterium]